MRLLVIGLGQCGSRVADQFVRLNKRAAAQWGINIVTGTFAVNTDQTDLTGLTHIGSDFMHRILIGGRKTWGHGVGKINEMGAELAREDGDKVVDAVRTAPNFYQTHAFMLIAGAAGGTGSGAISVIAQMLKERYVGKPCAFGRPGGRNDRLWTCQRRLGIFTVRIGNPQLVVFWRLRDVSDAR